MKASKTAQFLASVITVIFVLLPFHAVFTTWLGANLGHIDLWRIWKELLMVPLTLGALWLTYSDKQLKKWFLSSLVVRLVLLYATLHLVLGIYALGSSRVTGSALIYSLLINLRFLIFFLDCLIVASQVSWLGKNWQKYILWPAIVVIVFSLLQQFVLPANFLTHFGYGPKTIPAYQTVDQKPQYVRLQSSLRGPNPLGAYLVLVITALSAVMLNRKKKLWWSLLVLSSLIVLFFTYSRSAWLGAAIATGLLGYWLLKKQRSRRIILSTAAVVIVLLGVGLLIWQKNSVVDNTLFHTSQTSRSPESSNAVRTQAMLVGARSVIRQPLGGGPGTAGPASFRNNHPPRIAENYFIQIGQEVGFLGLAIFIAINLIIAKLLWQQRDQLLVKILLASLVGLTLVNLMSHAWADDTLSYIWWGLAGIALASSGIMNKQRKHQHV